MAQKISDSRSFKIQPLQKKGFVFQFSKVPGNEEGAENDLAFVTKTCGVPKVSFGEVSVNRFNEKFYYAGSPEWQTLPCTFYDMIRSENNNSAGDILYRWQQMAYNAMTGQQGYKTQYATSATLAQIDPAGNIIRAWNIFGIWPTNVESSDLDYGSSDACEYSCTFRYDLAVKVNDAKSSLSA